MTQIVYNKRHKNVPDGAIYVGRGHGSSWGNPFSHKDDTLALVRVATIGDAISEFEKDILSKPERVEACRNELAGKDLICWCVKEPVPMSPPPYECHAQVLLWVANAPVCSVTQCRQPCDEWVEAHDDVPTIGYCTEHGRTHDLWA